MNNQNKITIEAAFKLSQLIGQYSTSNVALALLDDWSTSEHARATEKQHELAWNNLQDFIRSITEVE